MNIRQGHIATLAAGLALVAITTRPAAAQTGATGGAWSAFVGCWEPVGLDGGSADGDPSRVCVMPAAGASAVDVTTIREGKVANVTHLEATGAPRAIGKDGCTGTESARWSADRMRVYLGAEITCDGVRRRTSGMMAMSPTGEWLDVQGVVAGQNAGVHVMRYRPVTNFTGIPSEIVTALPTGGLATSTARLAASGPVTPDAVIDASRALAAPVVEAWLLERGQGFKLNAKQLAALADAGVPGSVTDMMVALSFPKTFAINTNAREAELRGRVTQGEKQGVVSGRTIPVTAYDYSPYGWGSYYDYMYYGRRYGYGPYGYYNGGYGAGYYSPPIIIVRSPDGTGGSSSGSTHPRVVNGQGWTQGATGTAGSGARSGSSSGGSSSTGASSGGASSSSSSGSSSGSTSSSGGERTAHRVP